MGDARIAEAVAFYAGRLDEDLRTILHRPQSLGAERDPALRERRAVWSILHRYFVPTRYPNSLPGIIPAGVYTREAAEGAVALAGQVVSFVACRMGTGEPGR